VTQLYDDVDDMDDSWDQGTSARASGDSPLFEELRVAYLRGDDTEERDGGTGGWAAADDDWADWSDDTDASSGNGWTVTDGRAERALKRSAHHQDHGIPDGDQGGREGDARTSLTGDEDFVDRWSRESSAGGFLEEADPDDDWDPDEFEEADEEPGVAALPRSRSGQHGRAGGHGRVALRRTATLLNASTVMVTVAWLLVAAGFGGLVLVGRLLTTRQLFFMIHSGLGIAMVHAFGGGIGTLITGGDSRIKDRVRKLSTAGLAVVAWLASAVGTWGGYAGYRAKVPPGGNIGMYPREYLLHSPGLAFWETFAMEWKVHVGWTTPFLATAVAFVALRYRRRLVADPLVRKVMTIMLLIAFAGALVAAVMGAMVNVTAPNDFMHRGWSP
jgi:hypothetical protein